MKGCVRWDQVVMPLVLRTGRSLIPSGSLSRVGRQGEPSAYPCHCVWACDAHLAPCTLRCLSVKVRNEATRTWQVCSTSESSVLERLLLSQPALCSCSAMVASSPQLVRLLCGHQGQPLDSV